MLDFYTRSSCYGYPCLFRNERNGCIMTTLTEKHQQELKDHRDSQNKDRLYQATLKEVKDTELQAKIKLGREVQELEMKHHNWLLDEQMKMITKELKEFISDK